MPVTKILTIVAVSMALMVAGCGSAGVRPNQGTNRAAHSGDDPAGSETSWQPVELERLSDDSDPLWDQFVTPTLGADASLLFRATGTQHLDGVVAALNRAQLLARTSAQSEVDWRPLCHVWPAVPTTLNPWQLSTQDALAVSGKPGKAQYEMAVEQVGPSEFRLTYPVALADGSLAWMHRPLKLQPTSEESTIQAIGALSPEHPLLQEKSEARRQAHIREYGRRGGDNTAAYYGELTEQVRELIANSVWQRQAFPVSLREAFLSTSLTLAHGQVVETEAEPADLQVFFDGEQSFRFITRYPSGLEEDSVLFFTKVSLKNGVSSDWLSYAEFDAVVHRNWTFLGGIKLPPFDNALSPAQLNDASKGVATKFDEAGDANAASPKT